MAIFVDVVTACEGCDETHVIEHAGLAVGERPPAISLPPGWNGVDTGRILCPRCSATPVPQKRLKQPPWTGPKVETLPPAIAEAATASGARYSRE